MTRFAPNCRRSSRSGFTLLEAILALGILAAATIIALGIRSQMIQAGLRQREAQREDRSHEALFEMLVSGMLEDPKVVEDVGYVWEGEFLDRPYRITRKLTRVPNPMVGEVSYTVSSHVGVYEYRIVCGGRESTLVWYQ